MKVTIKRSDYESMLNYALSQRPDEACGLIAGKEEDGERHIEKVYLLTNTDHTNEHFSINLREQLAAVKDMRGNSFVSLGNWHSHPESPSRPSEEDKRLANDSRATYMILSLQDADAPVLNAFHIEGAVESRSVRKEELIILEDK